MSLLALSLSSLTLHSRTYPDFDALNVDAECSLIVLLNAECSLTALNKYFLNAL